MSVDEGAVTYPIPDAEPGNSKSVKFIGMTRNGGKVFFTSEERLTSDDNDNSTDLYMWSENGGTPTLTRISQGNGNGDTDACSASWIAACGIQPLTPERAHPNHNTMSSVPGMDDLLAEESGDVYFYSPEQLDAAHPGVPGQRNLYLYRHGAVQLVATFEAGTEVTRDQISPDGAHAAFLTKSQLTSYDNDGFDEVYTYEPDTRKTDMRLLQAVGPAAKRERRRQLQRPLHVGRRQDVLLDTGLAGPAGPQRRHHRHLRVCRRPAAIDQQRPRLEGLHRRR